MQAGVLVQRGSVKHSSQMDRLAINHITTRRWSLQEAIVGYAGLGVRGIGIWPDAEGFRHCTDTATASAT